jgi:hypothetical protein
VPSSIAWEAPCERGWVIRALVRLSPGLTGLLDGDEELDGPAMKAWFLAGASRTPPEAE